MWKPNKKILFILFFLNATLGGICFSLIDWSVFETGKGIYDEISLTLVFTGLTFFFMIPYVKKLKEEKTNAN
ncbi:MAG: hypothetical protein AB8B65_05470 [Kordia sp.]|uniref:hypothetical protein n=1 Tax=Kordia sp. TaxID=1965332 RepID=UPI00385C50F6